METIKVVKSRLGKITKLLVIGAIQFDLTQEFKVYQFWKKQYQYPTDATEFDENV